MHALLDIEENSLGDSEINLLRGLGMVFEMPENSQLDIWTNLVTKYNLLEVGLSK